MVHASAINSIDYTYSFTSGRIINKKSIEYMNAILMHGVVKHSSNTTKLQVIFDASAQS